MPTNKKEYTDKVCKDCGQQIEYLADFPGPRCLTCHAKHTENMPLERPDFTKSLRMRGRSWN